MRGGSPLATRSVGHGVGDSADHGQGHHPADEEDRAVDARSLREQHEDHRDDRHRADRHADREAQEGADALSHGLAPSGARFPVSLLLALQRVELRVQLVLEDGDREPERLEDRAGSRQGRGSADERGHRDEHALRVLEGEAGVGGRADVEQVRRGA
jgi:hypothetical protein